MNARREQRHRFPGRSVGRVRVLLLAAGAPSGGHGRQDRRGQRQGSGRGVAPLGEHRRDPADLPSPLAPGGARTVSVELEAVELVGKLANETTYTYWTLNGKVPGPFLACAWGTPSG